MPSKKKVIEYFNLLVYTTANLMVFVLYRIVELSQRYLENSCKTHNALVKNNYMQVPSSLFEAIKPRYATSYMRLISVYVCSYWAIKRYNVQIQSKKYECFE